MIYSVFHLIRSPWNPHRSHGWARRWRAPGEEADASRNEWQKQREKKRRPLADTLGFYHKISWELMGFYGIHWVSNCLMMFNGIGARSGMLLHDPLWLVQCTATPIAGPARKLAIHHKAFRKVPITMEKIVEMLQLWPFSRYNWLFLWGYTFYKWGSVSTWNW